MPTKYAVDTKDIQITQDDLEGLNEAMTASPTASITTVELELDADDVEALADAIVSGDPVDSNNVKLDAASVEALTDAIDALEE